MRFLFFGEQINGKIVKRAISPPCLRGCTALWLPRSASAPSVIMRQSPTTVTSELEMPSMEAMMSDEMRVFALAAYGGARELKELLGAAASDEERRALCNTADPETGTTPLIVGVKRDNSSVALALIEAGADVHQANKKGWTLSSVAAEFASPKLVQLLASHDPNDKRTEIVR